MAIECRDGLVDVARSRLRCKTDQAENAGKRKRPEDRHVESLFIVSGIGAGSRPICDHTETVTAHRRGEFGLEINLSLEQMRRILLAMRRAAGADIVDAGIVNLGVLPDHA